MRAATLMFAISVALAPTALQAAEQAHPERLMLLLNLIDRSPSQAELIAAGGGEKGEALVRVAFDRSLALYPRMRAAGALGFFAGADVERALARIVDDPM